MSTSEIATGRVTEKSPVEARCLDFFEKSFGILPGLVDEFARLDDDLGLDSLQRLELEA